MAIDADESGDDKLRILVIGCKGMLGTDLMTVLGNMHEVDGVDIEDVDITDYSCVEKCIAKHRPDIVINAAAYTNVDGAETDPDAAFAVNAVGAGNVARASKKSGAYSIYYSTDYVFDGTKGDIYTEADEPNPRGIYAKSKRDGEIAALEADPASMVARTAWLYGLAGKNFVETMLKLADEKDELGVVDDQRGSPTWSMHLAEATSKLLVSKPAGIVHVTNSGDATWCGFANKIFECAGKSVKVVPITTEELGRPAPRPKVAVLDGSKYRRITNDKMPTWEEALAGYLLARSNASKR